MKPETADYLAKSRECLDAAKKINGLPVPQVAAKEVIDIAERFVNTIVRLLPTAVILPARPRRQ